MNVIDNDRPVIDYSERKGRVLSYFAARRPDTMCKDSSPMARHPMMAFTKR